MYGTAADLGGRSTGLSSSPPSSSCGAMDMLFQFSEPWCSHLESERLKEADPQRSFLISSTSDSGKKNN